MGRMANKLTLREHQSLHSLPFSILCFKLKACAHPTFFFQGRCYDMCPIRTYSFNRTDTAGEFGYDEINQYTNLDDGEEMQSVDRKKRNEALYRIISKFTENRIDYQGENINMKSCKPCDKSCLRCYGPFNSQCIACPFGSELKQMVLPNETYCINFSERSSGNAFETLSTHSSDVNILLLILVPSVIVIAVVVFYNVCSKRRKRDNNEINSSYSYDRVALIADEEDQEEDIDFLSPLPPAIKIYNEIVEK